MSESDGRRVRRILWAAGIGAAGTSILNVANDLVAIIALGAGPAQVGLLNALESTSYLLLAVPVGWWLDHVHRERAMLFTQASASVALFSIPVAWFADLLTFWHLATVSFLVGTAGMVWSLGLSAILPSAVSKDNAGSTFAKLQSVETATHITVPGLTGALLILLAAPLTLFFAGVANVASGVLLWRGSPLGRPDSAERLPLKFWPGVSEGFRFTVRSPPILLSTCAAAVANSALALLMSVLTVYLVRVLEFEPAIIGLQGTIIGMSGFAGSLIAVRLLRRFRGLPVACVAAIIGSAAAVLLPLTALRPENFAYTFTLLTGFNATWNITAVIASAGKFGLLAAIVPNELMGRVQAFRRLISRGPVPIVAGAGGLLGGTIGLVPTLWVFFSVATISGLLHIYLWFLLRRWDLP